MCLFPKHSISTAAANMGLSSFTSPLTKALYKPVILLQKTLSLKERSGSQTSMQTWNDWVINMALRESSYQNSPHQVVALPPSFSFPSKKKKRKKKLPSKIPIKCKFIKFQKCLVPPQKKKKKTCTNNSYSSDLPLSQLRLQELCLQ